MVVREGQYVDHQHETRIAPGDDPTSLRFARPVPAEQILDARLEAPTELKGHAMVVSLDSLLGWARSNSLWPLTFGLACCAIEMIAVGTARWDIARFGAEVFRPSPRQADVMIVSGTVTTKMAPVVRRLYDQMADPKYVIAMGTCVISGGPYQGSYSTVPGIDNFLPVDVYLAGCPPRPDALLRGIMQLQEKIKLQAAGRWKKQVEEKRAAERGGPPPAPRRRRTPGRRTPLPRAAS